MAGPSNCTVGFAGATRTATVDQVVSEFCNCTSICTPSNGLSFPVARRNKDAVWPAVSVTGVEVAAVVAGASISVAIIVFQSDGCDSFTVWLQAPQYGIQALKLLHLGV